MHRAVRRHIEDTYIAEHRDCVRQAAYELTVFASCGHRFVLMRPDVCPLAQAFIRWNRSVTWGEEKLLDRPVMTDSLDHFHFHFLGASRGMKQDESVFALELLNYFHVCSSVALYFAQCGLARRDLRAIGSRSEGEDWQHYLQSAVRLENPGWVVLDDRFPASSRRGWVIAMDPEITRRLANIGAPICQAYRRKRLRDGSFQLGTRLERRQAHVFAGQR